MGAIADAVTRELVQSHLTARSPEILEENAELLELQTYYMATEIEVITGVSPPANLLDFAVHVASLGVASKIELALFPEQVLGDSTRGEQLRAHYLSLREELRTLVNAAGGGATGSGLSTRAYTVSYWGE